MTNTCAPCWRRAWDFGGALGLSVVTGFLGVWRRPGASLGPISVKKAGSEPRLVGDSSISCLPSGRRLSSQVCLTASRHPRDTWIAFSLDVAKAHKCIRVHPPEQGFSLFCTVDSAGQNHWLVYRTCHCAWSAYWWSRAGAAYVRSVHRLLHGGHFLAMYIDDLLALFKQTDAPLQASLCIMLACALGEPLSWHKVQLSTDLSWIGWRLCFAGEPCASLPGDKRVRINYCSFACAGARGEQRVSAGVETVAGNVMLVHHRRAVAATLAERTLSSLVSTAVAVSKFDAGQMHEFAGVLSDSMRVLANCRLSDILPGWQLLSVSSREVTTKHELLGLPHRGGWWWAKLTSVCLCPWLSAIPLGLQPLMLLQRARQQV